MHGSKNMRIRYKTMATEEKRLGILLVLPAAILIALVIVYPIIYNIVMSFFKVSLNPKKADIFIGFANYVKLFKDTSFYKSLGITLCYVLLTVLGSTAMGLIVALLMNKSFKGRKIARSMILLPYVAPTIATIYVWKYMVNGLYGVINYLLVDILKVSATSPLWYDKPILSVILIVIFDIWRVFPYAFLMLLAALQTIDQDIYEAADVDGANRIQKFKAITFPALLPTIGAVMTLRTIWNFYKFDDVYLFSKNIPVLGVYLYQTAFSTYDMGQAASITIILFIIIFAFVITFGRKVIHR